MYDNSSTGLWTTHGNRLNFHKFSSKINFGSIHNLLAGDQSILSLIWACSRKGIFVIHNGSIVQNVANNIPRQMIFALIIANLIISWSEVWHLLRYKFKNLWRYECVPKHQWWATNWKMTKNGDTTLWSTDDELR